MGKKCNWCGSVVLLSHGKPYCLPCSSHCYKECIRCHRPFPDKKYFKLNGKRCNSCERKYLKAKSILAVGKAKGSGNSKAAVVADANNSHDMGEIVEYRLLSQYAKTPVKATPGSIGYDLYSAENCRIKPGTCAKISTDLTLHIPSGTYGRIADRSGLAYNLGLHVLGGVIDPDYQGQIQILLFNLSKQTVYIAVGMRIAQIIFEKAAVIAELQPSTVQPTPTERGDNGFGSTGNSS